jgi:hypothetical protein
MFLGNFRRLNPNYPFPMPKPEVVHKVSGDKAHDGTVPLLFGLFTS